MNARAHQIFLATGLTALLFFSGTSTTAGQVVATAPAEAGQHLGAGVEAERASKPDLSNLTHDADAQLGAQPAPQTFRAPLSTAVTGNTFEDLFGGLVGDVRRLPSMNSAKWIGVGAALSLASHQGDMQVTRTLSASNGLHETLESGRVIGGAQVQLGGALATYVIGRMTGSSRTATVGAQLFRAQLLGEGMSSIIKMSASRTRPDGTALSFPSGHTTNAFATATVLQQNFGWKVGIPAYAMATYVAASRVQMKRHYLSDVAFGAALGILAGRTVTLGSSKARFAVEPFAVDGGGGIGLTWTGSRTTPRR
jgi:membrane-associated phospholipid phosphatase